MQLTIGIRATKVSGDVQPSFTNCNPHYREMCSQLSGDVQPLIGSCAAKSTIYIIFFKIYLKYRLNIGPNGLNFMNQEEKDPEPISKALARFQNFIGSQIAAPDVSPLNNTSVTQQQQSASLTDEFDEEDDNNGEFEKPVNSAFDINIAEFPIAYLNRGRLPKNANKTEITYTDVIKGRDGKPVERTWTVEARSRISGKELSQLEAKLERKLTEVERSLGFGGPQTLEVIYELFQLWKEQGFSDGKIHIGTYYHFLKRLGWCTGKSDYQLLKKTLQCIHGIHIKAENALYLPSLDRYENRSFYLFPSLRTYTQSDKELNPDDYLYITVDEGFYKAIKEKTTYFIPFDRFYFKQLKPMEQKLALILAKVFTPYKKNQRFQWHRKIEKLAKQIPILATSDKNIRLQLRRTCDGLIQKEFPFLSKYSFENDSIVFYNNMQTSLNLVSKDESPKKDYDTVEWLINEQLKICGDIHSKSFYALVAKHVPVDIIYQALSEAKHEGKFVAKLYTKRIQELGYKHLSPYIKINKKGDNVLILNSEMANIELDLAQSKEKFNKRKNRISDQVVDYDDCVDSDFCF